MRAVAVLAYNRPEYLYVTLSSVFAAQGIDNWPVYVYFDANPEGSLDLELRQRQIDAIKEFPIAGASFTRKGTGLFHNFMRSFRDTFYLGYEEVLFLEEDNLMAVDALVFLEGLERNSFFYSLFRSEPAGEMEQRVGAFSPHGFLISRDSFALMDLWIRAGAYWGFNWPGTPDLFAYQINKLHFINYDGIFDALGKKYELPMLVPPRSFVAHFGLQGVNRFDEVAEERDAIQNELFAGDRHEWLPRLAAKLKAGDYSDAMAKRLFPKGFVYNPGEAP